VPQRYTLYMRKLESLQQGPPHVHLQKKAKLDEALVAHCRADLVTECMKKKRKTLIISGDFRFRFSAENMSKYDFVSFSAVNGISFSSAFSFTAEKNEKCFSVDL